MMAFGIERRRSHWLERSDRFETRWIRRRVNRESMSHGLWS